jgi:hypothetical protein
LKLESNSELVTKDEQVLDTNLSYIVISILVLHGALFAGTPEFGGIVRTVSPFKPSAKAAVGS